ETVSGIESKPHSRPYKAHLEIIPDEEYVATCGMLGRMSQAAGWGKTRVTEPVSHTLREVKLRLLDDKTCNHFLLPSHNLQIWQSWGPPSVYWSGPGTESYGSIDTKPPGVFTRISPYVSWINEVLNGS
ncbi:hypothetical protein EI555_015822, partial [Monodon monoceros]